MLDRALQLRILSRLSKSFPRPLAAEAIATLHSEELRHELAANLEYLFQHGLVQGPVLANAVGPFAFRPLLITAKGLDFMADDGGLGAILNVQVVKIHAESLRELLQAKVDQSPLPEMEKSELKKKLSALSTTALTTAASTLTKAGIDHLPNVIGWLRGLAGI